jgi:hypothetical protein
MAELHTQIVDSNVYNLLYVPESKGSTIKVATEEILFRFSTYIMGFGLQNILGSAIYGGKFKLLPL